MTLISETLRFRSVGEVGMGTARAKVSPGGVRPSGRNAIGHFGQDLRQQFSVLCEWLWAGVHLPVKVRITIELRAAVGGSRPVVDAKLDMAHPTYSHGITG